MALRPTAGQRTLDPLMVVRIHQGQLNLRKAAPVSCSSFCPFNQRIPGAPHLGGATPIPVNPTLAV
jgi:hypothetical protein